MQRRTIDRRTLLRGTGAAGAALLAGCSGQDGEPADGETPTDEGGGTGGDGDGDGGDGQDGGPDAYEIGMIDSLTGSLADFGERNQRGKDLALEDVNAVGVDGRDLEITVEDSESTPETGVSAAQKLVFQDEVPFLIGAVGSGVSVAIYDSVVQDTDVVQLSQNSTGLGLTDRPGLLRVSPSGRAQSIALADIITEDGYDEVAVTYVNNEFGESLADAFFEAYEGEVAFESPHDQEQPSYSGLLSSMNDSGAEAWLVITYQEEFATQVTEMFENGYEPTLYGADSNRGDTVIENTPEGAMDGMKVVEPSAPVESDRYQSFSSRFEDEHGEAPTVWSAFAYDAVVIAALSIQAADEFTGAALQETVRDVTRGPGETVSTYEAAHGILADGGSADDVDYDGVSGPIDFDENGDPVGTLQVFEVQDHEYVPIGFRSG